MREWLKTVKYNRKLFYYRNRNSIEILPKSSFRQKISIRMNMEKSATSSDNHTAITINLMILVRVLRRFLKLKILLFHNKRIWNDGDSMRIFLFCFPVIWGWNTNWLITHFQLEKAGSNPYSSNFKKSLLFYIFLLNIA